VNKRKIFLTIAGVLSLVMVVGTVGCAKAPPPAPEPASKAEFQQFQTEEKGKLDKMDSRVTKVEEEVRGVKDEVKSGFAEVRRDIKDLAKDLSSTPCPYPYLYPYPYPYPPTYPPYPSVYPGKFVASVYQGDEFDGGYVGSFESSYPINYDWGLGGPFGLTNYFSVRWEGTAWFEAGNYRFRGRADDGLRLYVDGRLLLDRWSPQTVRTHEATIYLSGGYATIQLEYRERTGYAQISLFWERINP